MIDSNLIFITDDTKGDNWFYQKYFAAGANARYFTFQLVLNLLNQKHDNPIIIETGCQRELDDLGAGMSTSIFAEYIERYGGQLITVDNCEEHLTRSRAYASRFPEADVKFELSDSVEWLKNYDGQCRLLYLDSLDYPIGDNEGDIAMQNAAQQHNLNEFLAGDDKIIEGGILLLDDNLIAGGGKPKVLKEALLDTKYTCLLDYQQSVWIKGR